MGIEQEGTFVGEEAAIGGGDPSWLAWSAVFFWASSCSWVAGNGSLIPFERGEAIIVESETFGEGAVRTDL